MLADAPELFAVAGHSMGGRIRCPTLVGVGDDDRWSPPAQHEQIAAALPNSVLTIIPASGHIALAEAREAETAALERGLAKPVRADA